MSTSEGMRLYIAWTINGIIILAAIRAQGPRAQLQAGELATRVRKYLLTRHIGHVYFPIIPRSLLRLDLRNSGCYFVVVVRGVGISRSSWVFSNTTRCRI
jgi:hypothetical protein